MLNVGPPRAEPAAAPRRAPCCAAPARALARQRELDAQTSCGDYSPNDPSMPIAADLARNRAFWSPGDAFADFVFWMRNNHSVFGLAYKHPSHPFSRGERLWVLIIQILLVSCISWHQVASTQNRQYALAESYGLAAPDPIIEDTAYGGPKGRDGREKKKERDGDGGDDGGGGGGEKDPDTSTSTLDSGSKDGGPKPKSGDGDDKDRDPAPKSSDGPTGPKLSDGGGGGGGYRRVLLESYEAAATSLAAEQQNFNELFESALLPIGASLFGSLLKELAVCRMAHTRKLERAKKANAERLGHALIAVASLCAFGGAAVLYTTVHPKDALRALGVVGTNLPTALALSWFAYQVAFLALLFPLARAYEWRRMRRLGRTPAQLAQAKAAEKAAELARLEQALPRAAEAERAEQRHPSLLERAGTMTVNLASSAIAP